MERYMASLILGTASFLVQYLGSTRGTICKYMDASLWGVHCMERMKGAFEGHQADQMIVEWRDGLGGGIKTLTPPCLL